MAVKLESTVKRYIGLSTDAKPYPSATDTIPAGSSFFETDTWKIARFDGADWRHESQESEIVDKLDELLQELREIKELQAELQLSMS